MEVFPGLIRNAQIGVFLVRFPQKKLLQSNLFLARLLGFGTLEEMRRDFSWEKHFSGIQFEEMFRNPAFSGNAGHLEAPLRRKDGSAVWAMISLGIFFKTGHLEGIVVDISERKRLEAQLLQVTDLERDRFGRDLHDGIGQVLTGISFLLHSLSRDSESVERRILDRIVQIRDMVDRAVRESRHLAHGLMSRDVAPRMLGSRLRRLIDDVGEVFGLEIHPDIRHGVLPRNREAASNIFRIAQEALNNVVKHSHAKTAQLTLASEEGRGVLAIRDDGRGFSLKNASSGGMGIRLMQIRASLSGGTFRITAKPGEGVRIVCSFPMKE